MVRAYLETQEFSTSVRASSLCEWSLVGGPLRRWMCVAGKRRTPASVYGVRMARVNITVPDGLLERAKAAGLNVSRVSASALADELDRRSKVAALDSYLRELDAELGPISRDEQHSAQQWADLALGGSQQKTTGRASRTA